MNIPYYPLNSMYPPPISSVYQGNGVPTSAYPMQIVSMRPSQVVNSADSQPMQPSPLDYIKFGLAEGRRVAQSLLSGGLTQVLQQGINYALDVKNGVFNQNSLDSGLAYSFKSLEAFTSKETLVKEGGLPYDQNSLLINPLIPFADVNHDSKLSIGENLGIAYAQDIADGYPASGKVYGAESSTLDYIISFGPQVLKEGARRRIKEFVDTYDLKNRGRSFIQQHKDVLIKD